MHLSPTLNYQDTYCFSELFLRNAAAYLRLFLPVNLSSYAVRLCWLTIIKPSL